MPATNTTATYGTITRTFHWLIALLILSMIPLGIRANILAHQIASPEFTGDQSLIDQAVLLFSIHKTLGVFIFFAAMLRILWAISQPKPGTLHPDRHAETFLASLVHWLLYASLVLVPLTGWIHHASTQGFAPIWWPFGQDLPFVPKDAWLAETTASLHIIFERVLVVAILLHVAGALKHHFIDGDATLLRMLRGTPAEGDTSAHSAAAPIAAVGVYAIALGVGAALGLFSHDAQAQATLEAAPSEWAVTDGSITFTTTQLGSEVDGAFGDWTSAISFQPDAPISDTPVGQVETVIAITSIQIGSSTDQAKGGAFFDAETHPTAVYAGDIFNTETGYEARGTLTIKDTQIPVTFPFALTLDGNTATMKADVTLDRMAWNIGTSEPTESNLAFEVAVQLSLVATRNGE